MLEFEPVDQPAFQLLSDWRIGIFNAIRVGTDSFSNLKSVSALKYVQAARFRAEHQLDECVLLNPHNRVAEGSYTNIFIHTEGRWFTPAVSEGGVSGVMRQLLLDRSKAAGQEIFEQLIAVNYLLRADAVVCCNAVRGITSVRQYGEITYDQGRAQELQAHLDEWMKING